MLLVLYNGGLMMQGGQITVGDLSAFLLYSGYVALSISGLSNFYSSINKAVGASGRLWHLIDRKPQIPLSGMFIFVSIIILLIKAVVLLITMIFMYRSCMLCWFVLLFNLQPNFSSSSSTISH